VIDEGNAAPTQPVEIRVIQKEVKKPARKRVVGSGCCALLFAAFIVCLVGLAYFLAPFRTNVLVLGIDSRPNEGDVSRSDTMILATVLPQRPYVGMLSIPRDLWVTIPNYGENRINTAHFFGEAENPGGGPQAAVQAVRQNFGVDVDYYARLRFDSFRQVVDALGGVDVTLDNPMSGYQAGVHHLDGMQALALVRDRQGSDDFFRMERGQILLKALWKKLIRPASWPKLPAFVSAMSQAIDTNIPLWWWPRLGFALLRVGPDGIDSRTINRDMVSPFTTPEGAQVLGPRWEQINPVLIEIFGQ
jgi:LCP family protein required for cell wall assembly